jgi:hypothetical protein
MEFIKPNLVYGPGLSIGQDDSFASKLALGFIQFGEDCTRSSFGVWHDRASYILGPAGVSLGQKEGIG